MKLSFAALAALLALPVAAQMAPAPSPDARTELQAATTAGAEPPAPQKTAPKAETAKKTDTAKVAPKADKIVKTSASKDATKKKPKPKKKPAKPAPKSEAKVHAAG